MAKEKKKEEAKRPSIEKLIKTLASRKDEPREQARESLVEMGKNCHSVTDRSTKK